MLNIYEQAKEKMAPADIDHWQSDLYLKKTPVSELLVETYDYKGLVSTFVDEINHEPWYEIPFGYVPFFRSGGLDD